MIAGENREIQPLKVMILDDDPADIELLNQTMSNMNGYKVQTFRAPNLRTAKDILSRFKIDVVIVDNCLGFESGIEAIRAIGGRKSDSAIIMVSGMLGRDVQMAALEAGAITYLQKRDLHCDLLEATIRSSMYTHSYENRVH